MGQPQKLEDRPPFVAFETVSVENRQATIDSGHYVGADVDYVYITPAGSKDRIERVVSDWFKKLEQDLREERIPPEWVTHFRAKYKDYKAGQVNTVNGTPILNWPGLSPSVVKQLQSLNMLAIEDVAAMNEEGIARIGMGGRALKQRAIDYLYAAENIGKTGEVLSALRAELDDANSRNVANEAKLTFLAGQVAALTSNAPQAVVWEGAGISLSDLIDDGPGKPI